jgi:phosphoglycolate phosphatase-like HAD superfamily hydrolase
MGFGARRVDVPRKIRRGCRLRPRKAGQARYGLAPEACVFIDDNEANVVSARAIGMETIHFSTPEALRAELISYGLPLEG